MEKLLELFSEFSFGLFFVHTALFLLLLFVLRKFAWKPILNAVEERENGIEEALNQAEKAKAEMANLKAENDKIIKAAKLERDAILKDAREIRDNMINEAKDTASHEATKIVENAKVTIENEKMAAMTDLKNQVAQLSLGIAEQVLTTELADKEKEEKLVENMINDITLN